MKNGFLNGYKWSELSRDERFYCARLFELINNDLDVFLHWLKDNKLYEDIDLSKNWEIAYEVCFYRDYYYWIKQRSCISDGYPPKRTFDLALFSDNEIIIIEAKAHEIFETKQVDDIRNDKRFINTLFNKKLKVKSFALAPSKYFEYSKKFTKEWHNEKCFDKYFTWDQMAKLFNDDTLLRRANLLRYTNDIEELIEKTTK